MHDAFPVRPDAQTFSPNQAQIKKENVSAEELSYGPRTDQALIGMG